MKEKLEIKTHEKLYGLDHLRAFAIILVFFFHYYIISNGEPEWLPGVASFGWTGVDLFFVLSGFLISSQLFLQIKKGQLISFKVFFIKRFFRIIPAYLATVAIYFCIPYFREKEALPALWKFLTFTQNFNLNLKDYGTFSHGWSLCVEEHFYFFLPIILIFLQTSKLFSKSFWLLIGLFLFGFAIRFYNFNYLYLPKINNENSWMYWYKFIYYPTYNRLDGLLVGVSIAAIYQFLPNLWFKLSKYGNHFIALSLVILTVAYFLCEDLLTFKVSVFGFPLIAFGFGILVLGSISPTSFLYQTNSKITTFIANLSFSLYLTHKGIIHTTHQLLKDFEIEHNIMLLICMITCVLGAYLLHLTIEKPFMKLRDKFI
ncbi:peptidoglycan/LPS O-acetylase OafA/YrhL [Flavobacterium cutihirudinis]|uniref:Peptidoglycan/LPS O-acetylase OafA/YrhL n=1 Tax=Flavobacterium cutihirudinis TaxID=1265740 RepID=A0A3D9FPV9_9FLAO|nr:acyltransferase [Flavobacterium cutihirudinis]RED22509.1 peptidoglycan/LPS O-acetylase OafA/YrhL [Flavobacterium cutihirudinis]